MAGERVADGQEPESALAAAVVRVIGSGGVVGGAGFLIAPDLVLTCAHVVSDVLGLPREEVVDVGSEVIVDLPLADRERDARQVTAEVWRWVPVKADQTGDVAVLRLPDAIPGARPLPMADAESVWDHEARVVGFTHEHPDGIWHKGRLRGATGRGWVHLSRADGEAVHVRRGFSGSPVWDDELGAAVGLVVAAQPVREAQQAFVMRTRTLVREVPELAEVLRPAPPFRGLATFQEADAEVFFGRDEDVARVVTALRGQHPSVTVYGPSGCGKSSVALAGVVPQMRQAGYDVLVVDAGRVTSPRVALATELFEMVRSERHGTARADSADQVEQWLGELGLTDTFHRVTGRSAARLLVVLDQAEALLNLPEPQVTETVELLFPERPPTGLRVLATLRADFMDAVLSHAQLGPALRRGVTLPLTPMTRDQLHQVIIEPLRRVPAVEYDPGLDRRILDDAGGEPGILPLLGFVLAQLWERRTAGRLQASTYEDLGGVSGALRRHAEQAWRECITPGDEDQAQRLLSGLVRVLPGSDTPLRRAVTREEAGEQHWRLAQALAERRLLVLSGGNGRPESAHLAHEALIAAWPTLAEQVRVDAEFLAARAEVQHDLDRWRNADSPADLLPTAVQLKTLKTRLRGREADLTEHQREFLTLARLRQRKRQIRTRVGWVAAGLVVALIAGLGTFLIQQSKVSAEREALANSRALVQAAQDNADLDPARSVMLALAAYQTAPTAEARNEVLRQYMTHEYATRILSGLSGPIAQVASSQDGNVVLASTVGGKAILFVNAMTGMMRSVPVAPTEQAVHVTVSADGTRAGFADVQHEIAWFDVHSGSDDPVGPIHRLPNPPAADSVAEVPRMRPAMSLDGRMIAYAVRGRLVWWNLDTNSIAGTLPIPALDYMDGNLWISPDNRTLLVSTSFISDPNGNNRSIVAIDLATGTTRNVAAHAASYLISGDRTTVAVCRQGDSRSKSVVTLHRIADGAQISQPHEQDSSICKTVAVDETGYLVALNSDLDGYVKLVDLRTAAEISKASFRRRMDDIVYPQLLSAGGQLSLVATHYKRLISLTRLPSQSTNAFDTAQAMLTNDGSKTINISADGSRIALFSTLDAAKPIAEAPRRQPYWLPKYKDRLRLASDGTLLADREGANIVAIREVATLRQITQISAEKPPSSEDFHLFFDHLGHLVTVSGSRIQQWHAQTGRMLASFNAASLKPSGESHIEIGPYPAANQIAMVTWDDADIRVIDVTTGAIASTLRVGSDVSAVQFDRSGHYMALLRRGGGVELWRLDPLKKELILSSIYATEYEHFWAGFVDEEGRYVLAANNTVRVYQVGERTYLDSYDFPDTPALSLAAHPYQFGDVSPNLSTIVYTGPGGIVSSLALNPDRWTHELCQIIGYREFTADERFILPVHVPDQPICDPPR